MDYSIKETEEDTFVLINNTLDYEIIKADNRDELLVIQKYLEEEVKAIKNEHGLLIKAQTMLIEYYQNLITDTLFKKLSDVDNMYALKTMLKETCDLFEDLIPKIEEIKDKQDKKIL